MINPALTAPARCLLDLCRTRRLKIATAESCTGGLVAATLTDIPGSSVVVDRAFVTYSNAAKQTMLGVPPPLLERFGAVSRELWGGPPDRWSRRRRPCSGSRRSTRCGPSS